MSADEPSSADEIEVTDEMIAAATRAMWDHAAKFNIVTLDEMHEETFRLMIAAALSQLRAPKSI